MRCAMEDWNGDSFDLERTVLANEESAVMKPLSPRGQPKRSSSHA